MPGKITINETADKQKVELTTGADGVTGGYYDAAGEWHDFGGGSADVIKVFDQTVSWQLEDVTYVYYLSEPLDITDKDFIIFTFNNNSYHLIAFDNYGQLSFYTEMGDDNISYDANDETASFAYNTSEAPGSDHLVVEKVVVN